MLMFEVIKFDHLTIKKQYLDIDRSMQDYTISRYDDMQLLRIWIELFKTHLWDKTYTLLYSKIFEKNNLISSCTEVNNYFCPCHNLVTRVMKFCLGANKEKKNINS
jgi:hypothetical protein